MQTSRLYLELELLLFVEEFQKLARAKDEAKRKLILPSLQWGKLVDIYVTVKNGPNEIDWASEAPINCWPAVYVRVSTPWWEG